jgi:peptidoglycan/xylan/chitin deacetylase (PgdA/CDA1 family)
MARSVFLMYHELERPGRALRESDSGYVRYVVPEDWFRAQMRTLDASGARGTSVGAWLQEPSAPLVITFDDGCESDWVVAAPVLREHGFGATFYVSSGLVGRRGFMAPGQVRELADAGFEIGCHSATHRFLPHLDDAELRAEVVDAKARLEDTIGRAVEHFSCPGGRWDRRVEKTVRRAGYRTMATSRTATNGPSSNRFRLGRVPILRDVSLPRFERICRGDLLGLRVQQIALDTAKRSLGDALYTRVRSLTLGNLLNR